ncbi:MAG: hypothetical protein ACFCVK_01970 [Acidimicrobiales bacterium]
MTRRTTKSRVTKPSAPIHGQVRRRRHGDHVHTERWCAHHQRWEQAD